MAFPPEAGENEEPRPPALARQTQMRDTVMVLTAYHPSDVILREPWEV